MDPSDDLAQTAQQVQAANDGSTTAMESLFSRYLPQVRSIVAARMGQRVIDLRSMPWNFLAMAQHDTGFKKKAKTSRERAEAVGFEGAFDGLFEKQEAGPFHKSIKRGR